MSNSSEKEPKSLDDHNWETFFSPNSSTLDIAKLARGYGGDKRHCIVLTNLEKFRRFLGSEYLSFEIALRTHCMNRIMDDWKLHLLDLSSNRLGGSSGERWEDCVNQLSLGVKRFERESRIRATAVFIVGDDSIVPMPVFDNPLHDEIFGSNPDADVDSDLPFSSLSTKDPFMEREGLELNLSVGRLPSGQLDKGAIALNYFKQSELLKSSPSRTSRGFGVTAEVWKDASQEVARQVGGLKLLSSPDVTLSDFPTVLDEQSNYFYFNVHGSDMDKHWFGEGQLEGCIPVASPEHFVQPMDFNSLVTEACYGARFIGHDSSQSALRNSMLNKTIAFSGSSRIAYGPASPPVGMADLIALHFLSSIKCGETFGEAFLKARQSLLKSEILTPHDQLTVVEFNLFADPTLTLPAKEFLNSDNQKLGETGGGAKSSLGSSRDPLTSVRSSLSSSFGNVRVHIPDILSEVRASLDSTWEKIRDLLLDDIYQSEPALRGLEPRLKLMKLGLVRKEILQISIMKKQNNLFLGRTVYTDRSGKILQELVPK